MKKKLRIVIAILLVSIVGFLSYKITSKLSFKKEVTKRTKTIPNFYFLDIKSTTYTEKDLPHKPTVFVYFNSTCDYCISEAIKIEIRLEDFKEVQLVFVSFEKQEEIIAFAKEYKLYNKENIVFLEDKKAVFSEIFDVNSIPYIVVYDANKNFLQKFKGATKIDDILAVLK
jgi:thiol-disulfide isomerase/thioredoxin